MGDKRSTGVIIAGLILLLVSFIYGVDLSTETHVHVFLFYGMIFITLASGIINLEPWARKTMIYISIFAFCISILYLLLAGLAIITKYPAFQKYQSPQYGIFSVLFYGYYLYFLTRPRVKEQFKPGGTVMENERKVFIGMVIARIFLLTLTTSPLLVMFELIDAAIAELKSTGISPLVLANFTHIFFIGLPSFLILLSSFFMKNFLRKITISALFLSMVAGIVIVICSRDSSLFSLAPLRAQLIYQGTAIFILTRHCYKYYC